MISLSEAFVIESIPQKVSSILISVNISIEKFPKKFLISSNVIFFITSQIVNLDL